MLRSDAPRLLVVPGLHDSGPAHWQTWLQALYRDAVRVTQRDWHVPDLDRWAARVGSTLDRTGHGGPWLVAAHSFGVLAVLRHIASRPDPRLAALLLVAPADPDKFGFGELLPQAELGIPATLVLSDTDPWLSLAAGQRWARRWGAPIVNLGDAGHINAEAGFGPWPYARHWLRTQEQRLARLHRPARTSPLDWSLAV